MSAAYFLVHLKSSVSKDAAISGLCALSPTSSLRLWPHHSTVLNVVCIGPVHEQISSLRAVGKVDPPAPFAGAVHLWFSQDNPGKCDSAEANFYHRPTCNEIMSFSFYLNAIWGEEESTSKGGILGAMVDARALLLNGTLISETIRMFIQIEATGAELNHWSVWRSDWSLGTRFRKQELLWIYIYLRWLDVSTATGRWKRVTVTSHREACYTETWLWLAGCVVYGKMFRGKKWKEKRWPKRFTWYQKWTTNLTRFASQEWDHHVVQSFATSSSFGTAVFGTKDLTRRGH